MNILYITNLSTNISSGLNWSVPATVNAQSKIDNVLWVNLTNTMMPHWQQVKAFHTINEFGNISIDVLPAPFNNPDIVVFEGFYHPNDPKLAKELKRKKIPYIVTPRGSLTRQAQNGNLKKKLKKVIANFLIFKPYTKAAAALQYLTEAECRDSGISWNRQSFIIPNGFNPPTETKEVFSLSGIKAIFIGRLDMYHKGLDSLLEGCKSIKDTLIGENFTLDIYGPKRYDYERIDKYIKENGLENIISLKGETSGSEKEQALLNSDLFILTSRFEGHPMGLVEAIAYGLPCLVSPGSNMSKEILDSHGGWVCQTDAESIAETIVEILKNKKELPAKGENAKKLSLSYNWDNIACNFHDEVVSILGKSKQ